MTWNAVFIAPTVEFGSAPQLRREFSLYADHGAVASAQLAVTALGLVETLLNGPPVSEEVLAPGWSSYEWRLRVARYDVTDRLSSTNVLGLTLGNGWYRGRVGWTGRDRLYGDRLAGFAELTITYEDGVVQRFGTDESWSAGPSAILSDDLYDGETIDARLRDSAWLLPGFENDSWSGVEVLPFDMTRLDDYVGPAVSRQTSLRPQRIWKSGSTATVLDFGQNLVGWLRLTVRGERGTEIVVRHAEVVEGDEIVTRPLRSAAATDRYFLSGGDDLFEPTFTFHGFRYAEITGWPGEVTAADVSAVVIGSDLDRIGTFACSNELINRFHANVVWSMRGNFVDVPTDCPQRDERLGWTGDIAAFAPAASYLYDVKDFLRDWLLDLALEQRHQNGVVPYVVPDAMKFFGIPDLHGDPTSPTAFWGDAAVWVPWQLWQAYGDRQVLEDQFASMVAHVRSVASALSPTGLWDRGFQFGDWLDPDAPPDAPGRAKADPGVVATACAYRTVSLVAAIADLIGHPAQHLEFEELARRIRAAFNEHYVERGRIRSDCATVYALSIVFGLLDEPDLALAGVRLAELTADAGYRMSTGFAGTPFVADALTVTGNVGAAYRLFLQQDAPSWLYPVTMGATTIWERWDSMLPDGSINAGNMTSFNHYALGAVADWVHRTIGGIAPLAPGYSRVLVAPQPGGDLSWASASLRTPHGRIAVDWVIDDGRFTVSAEIPPETTAVLRLPGRADIELGPGRWEECVPAPYGATS